MPVETGLIFAFLRVTSRSLKSEVLWLNRASQSRRATTSQSHGWGESIQSGGSSNSVVQG